MKSILLLAVVLVATGAWALEWKARHNPESFLAYIPTYENKSFIYQLVNDKPFLFQLSPLSHNCTGDGGVSVNLVGELTDPRDLYNFSINFDFSRFNQTGLHFCKLHAIDLYTNETTDLDIWLTLDSFYCTYHPTNICGKNQFCNQKTEVCQCIPNYYTPDCDKYCEANTTCSGHGYCSTYFGDCRCDEDHVGSNCSRICNRETSCSGHGCESEIQGSCNCDTGYWGKKCENKCECKHGYCSSLDGTCDCKSASSGYYGPLCQYTCLDCQMHGGGCTNTTQCLCPGLKYGDICEHDRTLLVIASAIGGALVLILITFCLTKRKYSKNEQQGYEAIVN